MIIVMKPNAPEEQIDKIAKLLGSLDLGVHISKGQERTIIGVIGDKRRLRDVPIDLMPGVDKLVPIVESYKLSGKTFKQDPTIIELDGLKLGGDEFIVMAGPCAVESEEQIFESARIVSTYGARILRGGTFKPRTSPYSFQGLEEKGLRYLERAGKEYGLLTITEVTSERAVEIAFDYVDLFQIGARNSQNFMLLREIGRAKKPVVFKRGPSTTIEEWLNAAEYIMSEGNYSVILCERGIRTFENATRNTLDISAVPVVKSLSHLPIIVDPSHSTGKASLVAPLALAGAAAGADGIIVEVHPNPMEALSDASQQLDPEGFRDLMKKLRIVAGAVGKSMGVIPDE